MKRNVDWFPIALFGIGFGAMAILLGLLISQQYGDGGKRHGRIAHKITTPK